MLAANRNTCWTLLLPVPRDCGQVPACPGKNLRDSVAAAFQGLWKITTHIWHQASPLTTLLFQHQRMWPPSGFCWDQVASTISTKCPSSSGTAFPRVAREPPGPHSVPGDPPFPPEHPKVSSGGVADSALLLFKVLMEFKPSPFSLFSLDPAAVSNFPLSLQLLLGPLSACKSTSLPAPSSSPSSPLRAAHLLNSVVQVVQIVVLILQSVF